MTYEFDPLSDPRWPEFVAHHRTASIFHTVEWLQAVHQTYGYVPAELTNNAPSSDLRNALVFCRVDSWLTGKRLVSLPFSDHCEPLAEDGCALAEILGGLEARARDERSKYVELRPVDISLNARPGWHVAEDFYLHRMTLRGKPSDLLLKFQELCTTEDQTCHQGFDRDR